MTTFTENAGSISGKKRDTFRVQLISAGQGSSGFYEGAMLERDIAVAMPKGTHVYMNHTPKDKRGEVRDVEDFVGVLTEDAAYEGESESAFAPVKFRKDVAEFLEEFKDDLGVSIEIYKGSKSKDGVVEELGYSPLNALAVVTKAGANGKVLELVESFREVREDMTDRNETMELKDIEALLDAKLAPLQEAVTALTPVAPKTEEVEGPTAAEVAEALVTSTLTAGGRAAVYAAVESGVTVEEAIKAEKTREDEIRESLKTPEVKKGRQFVVQEDDTKDWSEKGKSLTFGKVAK